MCAFLPQVLSQHVFVLFTEQDIFFHKRIALSMFSQPHLPEVVGMTPDADVPQVRVHARPVCQFAAAHTCLC